MLGYLNFLGGIALLLLGIRSLRQGSERVFGARLRRLLQAATKDRLRSLSAGLVFSILTPSTTAVALLTVEAINAGYLAFQQVLALMLGANIGFTITVQLLAFKFYVYYAPFVVAGVSLYLFNRRLAVRGAGQILLGIGFLLLSLQTISLAVAPLRESNDVREIMHVLAAHPVWLAGFALVLELILQSPTATIGTALALVVQQILPVTGALAVVIGANIGIGVTALIAGFAQVETRRMAVGNLLFKLGGAAVCLPLIPRIVDWLAPFSLPGSTHDTQLIANADTAFNIVLALVFLPLLPVLARGLEKLIPAHEPAADTNQPRYLSPAALDSPPLALALAAREIVHMSDHARTMLRDAPRAFQGDEALCAAIEKHDGVVDSLNSEIKTYITQLSEQALNAEESRREMTLLAFANDIETIGDIIDKNLMDLARKKLKLGVEFSKTGWSELENAFRNVQENFDLALAVFTSRDTTLAAQLLTREQQFDQTEGELRVRHFHRLHAGQAESVETSALHLDVLTHLKHINSHLAAVARPLVAPPA